MNSTSKPASRQTLAHSRLRKHADYLRAYAAGRKRHSAAMSWFLAPAPQTALQATESALAPAAPRVGLTVGKIMGKAHERNRIKRRMREALRRHIDLLPAGFDLILHPRRAVLTMEFAQLEREVVRILQQAGQQAEAQAREWSQKQVSTEAARSAKHSTSTAPVKPAS
jgi:ribonuclease P protein component